MRTSVILFVLLLSVSLGLYFQFSQDDNHNNILPVMPKSEPSTSLPVPSLPLAIKAPLHSEQINNPTQPVSAPKQDEELALPISEEQITQALQSRSCRNIPATQQKFDAWLQTATNNDEPPEYIENVITRFNQCSLDVRTENYLDLLIKAAEQGNSRAISSLWMLDRQELRQTHQPRKEWLAWLYQLSSQQAAWGDETLAARLSTEYQRYDPQTAGQSYAKALAWAQWVKQMSNDNQLYQRADWIEQTLYPQLTANEIEQAQQLFYEIKQRYLQHHSQ